MSIQYPIPHKAVFHTTSNVFSAAFTGIYDFNTAGNTAQTLLKLIPNTIYLIDNFNFAGNVSKEDYLSAIDLNNIPTLTIKKKNDKGIVYDKPIILTQFYEDKTASAFIKSQQDGDEAQITFSAKFFQTANLIGLNPFMLTISFNIFYIDDNTYNKTFADSLNSSFSDRLNK